MPNGGSDCCAKCIFKKKLEAHQRKEPWINTYCSIRNKHIINPGYTYCANWHTRCKVPQGPIFVYGIYSEGDIRIPWHNDNSPLTNVDGVCLICNKKFQNGIEINDNGILKKFCSCIHYIQWWKKQHPNELLLWDFSVKERNWQEIFLKFYDEALNIDSINVHALFKKALLHHDLGQYEETLKCFQKATKIDPKNALAWNNKGFALEKLYRIKDAVKCYKKALKIDSKCSKARENLDRLNISY